MEIVIVAVALIAIATLIRFAVHKRYRAIEWRQRTRWIRFYPNLGFRLTKNMQWSRAHGWGRR